MKIAIVGAGFTGLSAAYKLASKGHEVSVFESESGPGGLAGGFSVKGWDWQLEKHYHHLFVNDNAIIDLAREIGHRIIFTRPKTSVYLENAVYQLDSPLSLLLFPHLPLSSRLRTGIGLLYLKTTNNWKLLERFTSGEFILRVMGKDSWNVLWKPLFQGKFGDYYKKIPASWFWARIKKRTTSLGYPEGGFVNLSESIEQKIKSFGGKVYYKSLVEKIKRTKMLELTLSNGEWKAFDRVICTLPTQAFVRITEGLPKLYVNNMSRLSGLGAITTVLLMKKKFFQDGTYWLNINDRKLSFLALVEHTNLVDSKKYAGNHLLYIGNYLPTTHPLFQKSDLEVLETYIYDLGKVNPNFDRSWIKKFFVFRSSFAQPIYPTNYSSKIPGFVTPIDGLFLANIQQVYPWDRGTNYAVELGLKVADLAINHGK